MSAELPSQLLTPEDLAWIWQYDVRTVATWTGGRKKKPQITLVRKGRFVRFTRKAVLKDILAHTIEAAYPGPSQTGHQPGLANEDMERLERFIQVCVKSEVERALSKSLLTSSPTISERAA